MEKIQTYFCAALALAFFVLFAQLTHEFAHWSMSEWLGYDSYMKLNSSGPLRDYSVAWHSAAVDAAGPLFTVLSAVLAFTLVVKYDVKMAYPLLLVCFLQRLLASIFGIVAMHNDEARVSLWLGMHAQVLPFLTCLFLFSLVYIASKKLMITVGKNISYSVMVFLYFFAVIGLDHLFLVRFM